MIYTALRNLPLSMDTTVRTAPTEALLTDMEAIRIRSGNSLIQLPVQALIMITKSTPIILGTATVRHRTIPVLTGSESA